MSHSHQRKAAALAASFVVTTLTMSGCERTPEVTVNPPPPPPPEVSVNPPPPPPPKTEQPKPEVSVNPPMPAPK